MDHDGSIAEAARTYIRAADEDRRRRTEGTKLAAAAALTRLRWLVLAEQYEWDEEAHGL